ncbi:MAG TPA: ATP-dependent sacrificial sulfur transferase LarE [Acidimicrobiales bacterium]|nr:ATP-dependent sacrificial sulfur transferase LarE [Acidimicrobiales bacterium]
MSLQALRGRIADLDRVVVAFSGGVDSALLARVSHEVLGDRSVAVTAVSESLAPSELDDCRRVAHAWGMRWLEVGTDELARPEYVRNDIDRCYHCKSELMDRLQPVADAEGGAAIALGVNLDDLDDHRPGQKAARERGAVFPLVDAGFTKARVRDAARDLGLDVWDKPAAACLASRVPYGTPVTFGTLTSVARAEEALKALGFVQLRVRHYGDLARIELPDDELAEAVERRKALVEAVKEAGYRYVTLDLEGFRSGNLNEGVVK